MASEPFGSDQMQVVLAVATEGSFSRAAAALGVTQSAVSQSVKAVEEALGRRLLARGARGVSPTPDGEAYLVYARAVMKVGADARHYFASPRAAKVIRLGLEEDLARTMLSSVLALCSRQYPDLAFQVECGLSGALLAGFRDGRYEAVIVKQPAGQRVGERLWVEPLAWYGRLDTPRPVPDPLCLAMFPPQSEARGVVVAALSEAGRPWRAVFQSPSHATLEAAVIAGVGVTALGRHLHGPGLVELGDDAGLPRLASLDVVIREAARGQDPIADAVCDLVREAASLSRGRIENQT